MVILYEINVNPGFSEVLLLIALQEKAPVIRKDSWLNDQNARNGSGKKFQIIILSMGFLSNRLNGHIIAVFDWRSFSAQAGHRPGPHIEAVS